jgi:hypothetical protein
MRNNMILAGTGAKKGKAMIRGGLKEGRGDRER